MPPYCASTLFASTGVGAAAVPRAPQPANVPPMFDPAALTLIRPALPSWACTVRSPAASIMEVAILNWSVGCVGSSVTILPASPAPGTRLKPSLGGAIVWLAMLLFVTELLASVGAGYVPVKDPVAFPPGFAVSLDSMYHRDVPSLTKLARWFAKN